MKYILFGDPRSRDSWLEGPFDFTDALIKLSAVGYTSHDESNRKWVNGLKVAYLLPHHGGLNLPPSIPTGLAKLEKLKAVDSQSYNTLLDVARRKGLEVGDFANKSDSELLRIRGIGPKRLRTIRLILE